jgi:anti-anti-sigma factor
VQQVNFAEEYDPGFHKLLTALSTTRKMSLERSPHEEVEGQTERFSLRAWVRSLRIPGILPRKAARQSAVDVALVTGTDDALNIDETFPAAEKGRAVSTVDFLCRSLAAKQWTQDRVAVVEFAATELLENAFMHGVAARDGNVRLRATLTPDSCDIVVSDDGPGFDLKSQLQRQLESTEPHEFRGLAQVHRLSTELTQAGRNTLILRIKRLPDGVKLNESDGVHFLELTGRMDMNSASRFEDQIAGAMEAAKAGKGIAVDLTSVEYISSAGLRLLMLVAKAAREGGTLATVISPTPLVREIFQISRFDKVLEIVESREEAISMLRQRTRHAVD